MLRAWRALSQLLAGPRKEHATDSRKRKGPFPSHPATSSEVGMEERHPPVVQGQGDAGAGTLSPPAGRQGLRTLSISPGGAWPLAPRDAERHSRALGHLDGAIPGWLRVTGDRFHPLQLGAMEQSQRAWSCASKALLHSSLPQGASATGAGSRVSGANRVFGPRSNEDQGLPALHNTTHHIHLKLHFHRGRLRTSSLLWSQGPRCPGPASLADDSARQKVQVCKAAGWSPPRRKSATVHRCKQSYPEFLK